MARLYTRGAINALYNYLYANINTQLAALRTSWGTSYPANFAHMSKRATKTYLFPRVIIHKDITERDYAYETQPLIEPWLNHNLVIEIEHMSIDLDVLDGTLMGYEEALDKMQEADDTFGNNFVWVRLGQTDWSPIYTNQENKNSIQSIQMNILCKSI